MRISVITPTANRQATFTICERWMARQTRQPDQWIVSDGGSVPVVCTMGQTVVKSDPDQPYGAVNFAHNLLAALPHVTGDLIAIMEDDDWYAPRHLERIEETIGTSESAVATGDDQLRYYHVPRRRFRVMPNRGAALCQTALHKDWLATLHGAIHDCLKRRDYCIDGEFWRRVPKAAQRLHRTNTVVGIKGLGGTPGLGIGHRPDDSRWKGDQDFRQLREWVGDDVDTYRAAVRA